MDDGDPREDGSGYSNCEVKWSENEVSRKTGSYIASSKDGGRFSSGGGGELGEDAAIEFGVGSTLR